MTTQSINNLIKQLRALMARFNFPVNEALHSAFITRLMEFPQTAKDTDILTQITSEAVTLLTKEPEYLYFLKDMDGFEFNGLILYSYARVDALVKNIFIINEFYRNNDDFINPDFRERLVIGEDDISVFTYDPKTNLFEIRDNVATDSVFGSFDNFTDFLSELSGNFE